MLLTFETTKFKGAFYLIEYEATNIHIDGNVLKYSFKSTRINRESDLGHPYEIFRGQNVDILDSSENFGIEYFRDYTQDEETYPLRVTDVDSIGRSVFALASMLYGRPLKRYPLVLKSLDEELFARSPAKTFEFPEMTISHVKDPFENPNEGIAVDASVTGGNPGWGEYKGVDIATNEVLFHHTIGMCTNNIAEFIALCHGVTFALGNGYERVYSDSQTARWWVLNQDHSTDSDTRNPKLQKGLSWANQCVVKITDLHMECGKPRQADSFFINGMLNVRKWDTINWGENPADFGRKNVTKTAKSPYQQSKAKQKRKNRK